MSLRITCPACHEVYPVDAGFADDDGKRLAALFADMEPPLGRAVLSYLRLFKPPKTALRTARAIKIVEELIVLVRTGRVCRDERGGLSRPASPATWAVAIEQVVAGPDKLRLPLANHHYLRAIVFGLADQVDATAERRKEADARVGNRLHATSAPRESPLQNELNWLADQLRLGALTQEGHDERVAAARITHGNAS